VDRISSSAGCEDLIAPDWSLSDTFVLGGALTSSGGHPVLAPGDARL
jgi:hypothetical protein